jgi:hypothetical protein
VSVSAPAGSMLPGIGTGRFKPPVKVPPYPGRPIIRPPWLPFIPPGWPVFPILEPPQDVPPGRDMRRAEPSGGSPTYGQPPPPDPSEAPSEYVRWVQSCLNQVMGFQLIIDGIMNTQTRSAIRRFQERRGLRIDGLVGPETERTLVDACKSPSTSFAQSAGFGPAAAAQPGGLPWAPEAEWESETVSRRRRRPASRPAVSSAAAVDRWVLPEEVRAAGEAQHVRYDSPGAWADGRNCSGSHTPGAQELRQYILTHFPGVTAIGGYACRQNTANKAETSVHGVGRALDIMIPRVGGRANSAIGDPIANWLVRNATAIGVQYLIWNRVSWNGHIKAPKDRPYTGPNPHTDHIHAELNHDGAGRKTPWFQRSPNGKPVPPPSPKPVPPVGVNYPPPPGYRVLRGPVPREVVAKAQEILRRPDPIGTQIPLSIGGKDYIFAVEWHKHAPTDRVPEALKRWHRGVTVYERVNGARQQPPASSAPPGYTPSLTRVRFAEAVVHNDWRQAFLNLNGLNMYEMLRALAGLSPDRRDALMSQRQTFRNLVNMPRIEYAMAVVQTGQLPSVVPGDLAATGQVQTAVEFLSEPVDVKRMTHEQFIEFVGRNARRAMAETGVPASVTVAQAILETGWGKHTIGAAKNLFGIKGRGPAGSVRAPTREFINGQWVTVNADFAKYDSFEQSISEHARFFLRNRRYARALQFKTDPNTFAREIHKAGYATAPDYADQLIALMRRYNLYRFDR